MNGDVHMHFEVTIKLSAVRSGYLVCFPLFGTKFIIFFVHITILIPYSRPGGMLEFLIKELPLG